MNESELQKIIAELKAELKKKTEFRVNKGGHYYYISENGEIEIKKKESERE